MAVLHITTRRCRFAQTDYDALRRRIDKLERQLGPIAPDRAHITVAITRYANRPVYRGSVRVATGDALYVAKRNAEPTVHAIVTEAFRDIQDQLQRHRAKQQPA